MTPDLQVLTLVAVNAELSNNDLAATASVLRLAADAGTHLDCEHAIDAAETIIRIVRDRLNEVESKLGPLLKALKESTA